VLVNTVMSFQTFLLTSSILLPFVAPAIADDYASSERNRTRTGSLVGIALATGNIGCETRDGGECGDVNPAGGLAVHVGGMVAPAVALLGEAWGMAHTENNYTASQILVTANVRAWAMPRLWFQGGLGVARSKVSYDDGTFMGSSHSDIVPAFAVGAGVELVSSRTFALDLQLRFGSGFYEGDARVYNTALALGLNWY
jgi:hypothetical protein